MSETEIRDKLEINLPPRVTMQVTALTIATGKTFNDVIIEALIQYINKKKNSHTMGIAR